MFREKFEVSNLSFLQNEEDKLYAPLADNAYNYLQDLNKILNKKKFQKSNMIDSLKILSLI